MSCINDISEKAINSTNSSTFAPEPEVLRITRTVIFCLIAALALIGNYVVCRAVWRHPRARPTAHYLISNLAFAEIISMVCLVFMFHAYEPPWSWKLGNVMCKILPPLQITSLLVITTTLAILAVYRRVLLCKPLVAKPTPRQISYVIFICWMGSVGLSVPAGYFRVVNTYDDNCKLYICQEVFPEGFKHYQDAYSVVLFIINFALPFVIMTISYSLVRKKIREHIFLIQRISEEQSKAMSSVDLPSTCVYNKTSPPKHLEQKKQETIELLKIVVDDKTSTPDGKSQRKRCLNQKDTKREIGENVPHNQNISPTKSNRDTFEMENDLLKMVYALVLAFVICYIPFQVNFLLMEFKVEAFMYWPHRHTFRRLVFTLTCLPSALHPVFYGMMSKFYRKAFIRIFSCRSSE